MIPDSNEKIILEARAPAGLQTVEWRIDGKSIGNASAPDFRMEWKPVPGKHFIEVFHNKTADSLHISVMHP
jgi:membrane carboxypeptidase/penicillin-binding protein PbpC